MDTSKLTPTSSSAGSTANAVKKDLLDLDCSSPPANAGGYCGSLMGRYNPGHLNTDLNVNATASCYLNSSWNGDGTTVQHHHDHQLQSSMLSSAFQDYSIQSPTPLHPHQHHLQHPQQQQQQQQQQHYMQPMMYDSAGNARQHHTNHSHALQHQHLQSPPSQSMPHQTAAMLEQHHQLKQPFGSYLPLCHQPLGDGLSGVSSTTGYHLSTASAGGAVSKSLGQSTLQQPAQLNLPLPPPPPPPPPPSHLPPPLPQLPSQQHQHQQHSHARTITNSSGASCSSKSSSCSPPVAGSQSRPDKRPVPDSQKDNKYFERRKRNNEAAKKSRDARKHREDEIAVRASFLEKENAVLKAQMASLREEANSLRELLRKHSGLR